MAKIELRTEADLVKFVLSILGDKWDMTIHETIVTSKATYSPRIGKRIYWWLSTNHHGEPRISASLIKPTLPQLIKAVLGGELWEKIRDEHLKHSVQWQQPGELDSIATGQRKLTAKRAGIAHKQAALPFKTEALPAASKQLLLPSAAVGPTCHWPGCGAECDEKEWACQTHWQKLIPGLQDAISQQYRPGRIQSSAYAEVETSVFRWISCAYPETVHS